MAQVSEKRRGLPWGYSGVAPAAAAAGVSPNRVVAAVKRGALSGIKVPPKGGRGRPGWVFRHSAVADCFGLAPRRFVISDLLQFCWLCDLCRAAAGCPECRAAWDWCGRCPPCVWLLRCDACGHRGIPVHIDDRPRAGDKIYCESCTINAGWESGEPSAAVLLERQGAGVA